MNDWTDERLDGGMNNDERIGCQMNDDDLNRRDDIVTDDRTEYRIEEELIDCTVLYCVVSQSDSIAVVVR